MKNSGEKSLKKLWNNPTFRKMLSIFLTIIVPTVTTIVTSVIGAYYNTEVLEAFLITIITLAFGVLSWFVVTILLKQINSARDSISDAETQEIQKSANIKESERCIHFTDVCSVSRALAIPGLNIPFDEAKKNHYRLIISEEFDEEIKKSGDDISIFSSDIVECEYSSFVFDRIIKTAREYKKNVKLIKIDFAPTDDANKQHDYPNDLSVRYITSINAGANIDTFLLSSFGFVFLIDKVTNKASQGYIVLLKADGFAPIYYKMPKCMNEKFVHLIKNSLMKNIVLRNKSGKEIEFTFKKISSFYKADLLNIQNKIIEEKISNDVFTPPTMKEISESFVKDEVIGVFDKHKLVAFMICVLRDDRERNLSYHIANRFLDDFITIDNVEVDPKYRGFSLEKQLLDCVEEIYSEKKLVAVVSKLNKYSLSNFEKAGYEVIKEIDIYNSKRLLVIKE